MTASAPLLAAHPQTDGHAEDDHQQQYNDDGALACPNPYKHTIPYLLSRSTGSSGLLQVYHSLVLPPKGPG